MIIKKAKRERIEEILKRITYRMYQLKIALVSHDKKQLRKLARLLSINAKNLISTTSSKKKKKIRKAEGNGKRRSNTIHKKGNKKAIK